MASAADGTILRTITAEDYNCSVGTGLAFDGQNLLLSCNYDNIITAIDPSDGSKVRTYTISGISAIGAIAWDRGRGLLWACGGFGGDDHIVHKINLDAQTSTQAFGGTQGCPDGLAFDGTDDTLYLSADVATTVQHYKTDGTLIKNIDVTGKLGGCGNSGIAVGGRYLFLANNGCSEIYRVDKNNLAAPSLFGSYPARIEDMECDDLTFRSQGKAAIWSKDAYDGILNAFELNVGDCGFGGQPPGSEDFDTDGDGLSDEWETKGIDVNHDGSIDLDLKAMGADPKHKDVFIETDWMEKADSCIWFICWGGENFAPMQNAISDVRAAFAAAPNANPDGTPGIRAHIDAGPNSVMNPVTGATWGSKSKANKVAHKEILGTSDVNGYSWLQYDGIKTSNFDVNRRNAFHYMLFANMYQGSSSDDCESGRCSSGISRGVPASDTLITDGHSSWGDGFTRIQERGTIMHEFGHNLNLRHGGASEALNNDPVYRSIMNYAYQLDGLPPNADLDYSRSLPYVDWAHLVFTGGSVGAFGVNLPTTTPAVDELDPATAKAAHNFAVDGDGTVKFVGPTVLLPGAATQQLLFDVTNVSEARSTYTLKVTAAGLPVAQPSVTQTIAAGATVRVKLPVGANLSPGTYSLTAELGSSGAGAGLSIDSASIMVPDLSDLAQLEQARKALAELRALPANSGLDPATREALIAALAAKLPWSAKVKMTGSPSDQVDATYTVKAPVFDPNATSRQSIRLESWPNTAELKLDISRVNANSANYKGTLQIKRPNGSILNATVSLVWHPSTNRLKGSWKEKGGGSLEISVKAP